MTQHVRFHIKKILIQADPRPGDTTLTSLLRNTDFVARARGQITPNHIFREMGLNDFERKGWGRDPCLMINEITHCDSHFICMTENIVLLLLLLKMPCRTMTHISAMMDFCF